MVMQAEEQHDQCITLRLGEDGREVGAAGAPAPRDHEGAGIAHHVHEVDEGRHHAAHDHEQHRELLVNPFEQSIKREYEEDQDHGTAQIAQHAESEEPLVRGDVASRRGCVALHEEFVGDVDKAQRAQQNKRSEEHTSELQSQSNLVCRLLLEKKKAKAHDKKAIEVMSAVKVLTVLVAQNSAI